MAEVRSLRVRSVALPLLLGVVILCPLATAKTLYVDAAATGLNNGSSWASAYQYLQDALAAAQTAEKPVEIRVAAGTYKPDRGVAIAVADPNAVFRISRDMTIRGGYAGINSPDPNAHDFAAYPTILSGDLAGNDAPVADPTLLFLDPTRSDNSFCVILVEGFGLTVVLDGLTIAGAAHSLGGGESGLYVSGSSSVTVCDCVFLENASGGIFCAAGSFIVLRCRFDKNWTVSDGGGIFCGGGIFRVEDCVFSQNVACGLGCCDGGVGGGFCSPSPAEGSVIRNCVFADNIASCGGGACLGNSGGGAVPGPTSRHGQAQVIGCTFIGNEASLGGALSVILSTVDVLDCEFRGNRVTWTGGAVENGYSGLNLRNCLFSGNSATTGGGCIAAVSGTAQIRNWDPVPLPFDLALTNCTLVGNRTQAGGAIARMSSSTATVETVCITNSILNDGGLEIENLCAAQLVVKFTDVSGGIAAVHDPCNVAIWGPGNIDADPLFANPGYWDPNGTLADANDDFWVDGDYHLKSQAGRWDPNSQSWVIDEVTSPCIDGGDPNTPVGDEPAPNGGRINMGCYGGTTEASKCSSAILGKPDDY